MVCGWTARLAGFAAGLAALFALPGFVGLGNLVFWGGREGSLPVQQGQSGVDAILRGRAPLGDPGFVFQVLVLLGHGEVNELVERPALASSRLLGLLAEGGGHPERELS